MAQWVVVQGQVKAAKKSKNTPTCCGPSSEPQTENENRFFFSISSRSLAESEDGLDSSLAQAGGESQRCKLAPKCWRARDLKVTLWAWVRCSVFEGPLIHGGSIISLVSFKFSANVI